FLCFFFQAEDGIRDDLVTGVQTCALPIWSSKSLEPLRGLCESSLTKKASTAPRVCFLESTISESRHRPSFLSCGKAWVCVQAPRSEERRVGKEGRCRRGRGYGREAREEAG